MKSNQRLVVLLSMLMLLFAVSCGDNGDVQFQGDDDLADLENTEPDVFILKGGSTGEGNPSNITVSFSTIKADIKNANDISWENLQLNIKDVFMSDEATCNLKDGEVLGHGDGQINISFLKSSMAKLQLEVPSNQEFCAIDFRLTTDTAGAPGFRAQGQTPDGKTIIIQTHLNGRIGFTPPEGSAYKWEPDQEEEWVLAFDLDQLIPEQIISQLTVSDDDIVRIDSENNSDVLEDIQDAIIDAAALYSDMNGNGEVDSNEEDAQNQTGTGDPTRSEATETLLNGPQLVLEQPLSELLHGLNILHFDACSSSSPLGDERKPFSFKWDWVEGRIPASIQEPKIMLFSSSMDDETPGIAGQWVNDCHPKAYLPVAGEYCIRVWLKDSAGVPYTTDPDCTGTECTDYVESCFEVLPFEDLSVELIWDHGEDTDLDLFLVRYRDDGTFGMASAYFDRIEPSGTVTMPSCTSDSDCPGTMTCDTGTSTCNNQCNSDNECQQIQSYYLCNQECVIDTELSYIPCETDSDCAEGYCSLGRLGLRGEYQLMCTEHPTEAHNDTCYYMTATASWGPRNTLEVACTSDQDCQGEFGADFTCDTGIGFCDIGCESSTECQAYSNQSLCTEAEVCDLNDTNDDPFLQIDDVDGWGPELISISQPSSGRYRVVARMYADPQDITGSSPNETIKAYVNIYNNGLLFNNTQISNEFSETTTYWKVADIIVDNSGNITVEPLCAGWTMTTCEQTSECQQYFGNDFVCDTRTWNDQKYCSTCTDSNPYNCVLGDACSTDADCSTGTCQSFSQNFCRCGDDDNMEAPDFDNDPYANPFYTLRTGKFDPNSDTNPRSIWCDDPADLYNATDTCSSLYGN